MPANFIKEIKAIMLTIILNISSEIRGWMQVILSANAE